MINKVEVRQRMERTYIKGENPASVLADIPDNWRERLVTRIEKELWDSTPPRLTATGRRLNNFCIGSDPEFAFARPGRSSKVAAAELGLKPALAAGCDQNQRLAELRGWPTRSVVEHVAGILASLRWMYRLYPYTRDYYWRAGAFFDGDGLGGHVHFGRKRPTRKEEIAGLDGVTKLFRSINCFSNKDWDLRVMGDARNQRYGDYGDFRLQVHGYEYRTHPSWLCSPLKAFFVVAVSKLTIYDPELVASWYQRTFTQAQGLEMVQRLAHYYAGRDDDAWILKHLLAVPNRVRTAITSWGVPSTDFKPAWGFTSDARPTEPPSYIFAACVAPDPSEVSEVAEHLLSGKPMAYRELAPTFKNTVPSGYEWLYGQGWASGLQNGGAGDLTHNLVANRKLPMRVAVGSNGNFFVSRDIWNLWNQEERDHAQTLYPRLRVSDDHSTLFHIDRTQTGVEGIRQAKQFVLGGLFPLWTVDSVKESSFDEWMQARKKATTKLKAAPRRSSLERAL